MSLNLFVILSALPVLDLDPPEKQHLLETFSYYQSSFAFNRFERSRLCSLFGSNLDQLGLCHLAKDRTRYSILNYTDSDA